MQQAGNIHPDYEQAEGPRVDIVALAALIFALFLLSNLVFKRANSPAQADKPSTPEVSPVTDPAAIAAPYNHYTITQGVHGASYGHIAIDNNAAKFKKIKSPNNGYITRLFPDRYGNPTLVIQNKFYK